MSSRQYSSKKENVGFQYGLSIPKFLQPYQNLLSENSVFKDQIAKEKAAGWDGKREEVSKLDKSVLFLLFGSDNE